MSLTIGSFLPRMLALLSACLTPTGPSVEVDGAAVTPAPSPAWPRQQECAFGCRSSLAEGHSDPHPLATFGGRTNPRNTGQQHQASRAGGSAEPGAEGVRGKVFLAKEFLAERLVIVNSGALMDEMQVSRLCSPQV